MLVICLTINGRLTFVHFAYDMLDTECDGGKIVPKQNQMDNDEFVELLMARD